MTLVGLRLYVKDMMKERVSDLLMLAEEFLGDRIALMFLVKVWYDKPNNKGSSD